MERVEEMVSRLDLCEDLADVGCDHGKCAHLALSRGICKKAYVSDVSEKCLAKAERLLSGYIAEGRCISVCCDGLKKIPPTCSQVLIAGMGGMEIIKILTEGFIPKRFVFQPMKNAERLRTFLLDCGCKITLDDVFYDDKYYFIIKGEAFGNTPPYSKKEIAFGRDSLNGETLQGYVREEIQKLRLAANSGGAAAEELNNKLKFLESVLK